MKINRRTFVALCRLVNSCTAPPSAGLGSTTTLALAQYADMAGRRSSLALRILHELPPHADREPEELLELLAMAEREVTL